jgi:hypothetical protein
LKKLRPNSKCFNRKDLIIYTNPKDFKDYLFNLNLDNSALLLMSSGNYGGLNFDDVGIGKVKVVKQSLELLKLTVKTDFVNLISALDKSLWERYPELKIIK